MADGDGRPLSALLSLYKELAMGGVGLIISGHMYIHPGGKAHPEMTGIYSDDLLPDLVELVNVVHAAGCKVAVQVNHGGMQCSDEAVPELIAPSSIVAPSSGRKTRAMTNREIEEVIDAFGKSARRVKQAGFDGVQIHAAHGYLISQFLSPYTNQREDEWGGNAENRKRFLLCVVQEVRRQVGVDYPVFIKLGLMDGIDGGLTLDQGVEVAASIGEYGIDGIEISGGIGGKTLVNARKGINSPEKEAYFLPFAERVRGVTSLPLLLVGGLRSRSVMERILESGTADFISLCRPLINDPYFPQKLRNGSLEKSGCLSSNNCWPTTRGEGIACKCPIESRPQPAV
jgi:2,4-dienoyl-CoA reductase-like NADH-dependent reductase (Old Yellow Enzyme family)